MTGLYNGWQGTFADDAFCIEVLCEFVISYFEAFCRVDSGNFCEFAY